MLASTMLVRLCQCRVKVVHLQRRLKSKAYAVELARTCLDLTQTDRSIKLAIAMHHTAFVPYSVTAGCSLTDNTDALLPVL